MTKKSKTVDVFLIRDLYFVIVVFEQPADIIYIHFTLLPWLTYSRHSFLYSLKKMNIEPILSKCIILFLLLLNPMCCLHWKDFKLIYKVMQGSEKTSRRLSIFEATQPNSMDRSKRSIDFQQIGKFHNMMRIILLSFILGTSGVVEASPLNKQMISIKGPFFQGWLIRIIDHSQSTSFILIIGSFSCDRSKKYNQHYIFCGIDSPNCSKQADLFPDPSSVTISGSIPISNIGLNITWDAKDIGRFKFSENVCAGNFNFINENVKIHFNTSNRILWNKDNDASGPEGWLGYTPLLPCHYFVHSVGSDCSYRIDCEHTIQGNGYAHIEGNHGTYFPDGWVWSQSIHPNNEASFSLVLGKFVIGGLSPINIILYIRRRNGMPIIFRSTDLDQFEYIANSIDRTVSIKASSYWKSSERVEVTITPRYPTTKSFGSPIFIPTAKGFSNSPGCEETYTALANITFISNDNQIVENYQFPLTALEFGGSFVSNKIISNFKIK